MLIIVAFIRELFGSGKVLGQQVLPLASEGGWYVPNGLMVLSPAAFFLLGGLIWGLRVWKPAQVEKEAAVHIEPPPASARLPAPEPAPVPPAGAPAL